MVYLFCIFIYFDIGVVIFFYNVILSLFNYLSKYLNSFNKKIYKGINLKFFLWSCN